MLEWTRSGNGIKAGFNAGMVDIWEQVPSFRQCVAAANGLLDMGEFWVSMLLRDGVDTVAALWGKIFTWPSQPPTTQLTHFLL